MPPPSGDTCRSALDRLNAAALFSAMLPRGAIEVSDPGVLRTPRLLIRRLQESDRERYVEMLRVSRRQLDRFVAVHEAGDSDDEVFGRQLRYSEAANALPDRAWRRVIVRDGTLVGAINLNDIQRGIEESAELVAWISSDMIGHGYATEAVEHASRYALAAKPRGLGLQLVYALIAPRNSAFIRVSERSGFAEESHMPMIELRVGAQWRSHSLFVREAATVASPVREAAKVVVRRLMMSSTMREARSPSATLQ